MNNSAINVTSNGPFLPILTCSSYKCKRISDSTWCYSSVLESRQFWASVIQNWNMLLNISEADWICSLKAGSKTPPTKLSASQSFSGWFLLLYLDKFGVPVRPDKASKRFLFSTQGLKREKNLNISQICSCWKVELFHFSHGYNFSF